MPRVPYLFTRDVLRGRAPFIFGDGNQVRDFVYINGCRADYS
jgi:nucleoside-diphosphate-sugar epimerase